jgi:hypothetical protein
MQINVAVTIGVCNFKKAYPCIVLSPVSFQEIEFYLNRQCITNNGVALHAAKFVRLAVALFVSFKFNGKRK